MKSLRELFIGIPVAHALLGNSHYPLWGAGPVQNCASQDCVDQRGFTSAAELILLAIPSLLAGHRNATVRELCLLDP